MLTPAIRIEAGGESYIRAAVVRDDRLARIAKEMRPRLNLLTFRQLRILVRQNCQPLKPIGRIVLRPSPMDRLILLRAAHPPSL